MTAVHRELTTAAAIRHIVMVQVKVNGKIKPAAFLQQVFFMRWRMWNFTQKRRYGVKIHKKTSIYLSILLLDKGEEKVYNNITVERG